MSPRSADHAIPRKAAWDEIGTGSDYDSFARKNLFLMRYLQFMIHKFHFVRLFFIATLAFGFTASSHAQFTGVLSNANPGTPRGFYSTDNDPTSQGLLLSRNFDQWQFNVIGEERSMVFEIDSSLPDRLVLGVTSGFPFNALAVHQFMRIAPLGEGTLRFDFEFARSDPSDVGEALYTLNGGSTWQTLGTGGFVDNFTINLASDDVFGFRVTDDYLDDPSVGHTLTISDISFVAIPEPGAAGKLAGVAALACAAFFSRRRVRASTRFAEGHSET
jgi:hypothetical protein